MQHVLKSVAAAESAGKGCEGCSLEVTSRDAIGEIQQSFNNMTSAIARRLSIEERWKKLHTLLSTSVELEEVAKTILTTVIEMSNTKAGLVYGKQGDAFVLLAECGIDRTDQIPKRIRQEYGPLNRALETGAIFSLSPDKDGLEWFNLSSPLGQMRPRILTAIPVMTKEQAVGLAIIAGDVDEVGGDRYRSIKALCVQAAPYLQNALLHRRIRDLAAIDDLTSILNRRFGFRRLKEEFSRAVRHGVSMSVMMVDVDRFKDFNDTFGHDAGDAVLKMVAATIESTLRSGDTACRYGGEEFMIVAPGTGLTDGAKIGERLRRNIETTQIRWGEQTLSVTVSVGVAAWPVARVSVSEELVSAADKALYAAKEAGRNQVAILQDDRVLPAQSLQEVFLGA
jgi:diguanylate cyclase (GGDEF)-like protein